jgi:phage shock protein E
MARIIGRAEVRRLVEKESAQLVEVLGADEYESEHIAGAVNIPLPKLDAETARRLDRAHPVIVYCHDFT